MEKYAQVIIDISQRGLDRPFSYRIPAGLQHCVRAGSIVMVPFGAGNTLRKGYVVGFADRPQVAAEKLKEIEQIVEPSRGYTMEDLERVRAEKAVKRGGFEKRILLKEVYE